MGRRAMAAAALAVLLAGWATADALDVAPGVLTTRRVIPEPVPYPEPTAVPAAPGIADATPVAVGDVQDAVDTLVAAAELGPEVSALVLDLATGAPAGALAPDVPGIPASSLKLLTAAAALTALGPDRTLPTTTVWDGTTLTLVGGGDVLLGVGEARDEANGHASLTDLASDTAAALAAEGVASVRLSVDDTLFTGPTGSPDWGDVDWLFVMPMAPLAVDGGRSDGERYDADPALAAGRVFAAELAAAGVRVDGDPVRARPAAGAARLARVDSAPVADVVAWMLKVSENSVAEALARLVAIENGLAGSLDGATTAVADEVAALGLDTSGLVLRDASGLSGGNRVTARLLAGLVAVAADPATLDGLLAGLPIAYLDGTLAGRLADAPGAVRAKTGTLATVVSLTGLVQTAGGGALAFSVLASEVPRGGVDAARARLDEFVAALASR